MILEKKCVICGKVYYKKVNTSVKNWEKSKCCSWACMWKTKIGNKNRLGISYPAWNKGIPQTDAVKKKLSKALKVIAKEKGFGLWMTGKKLSRATKKKIGDANRGILSKSWKGDKAKYGSKHMWIYKMKGKPSVCDHCGKTGLIRHKRQWANKDHKYSRNLEDWMNLCIPCHVKYDKKFN